MYQNEQNKACFQHVMAYGNFKDLTRITASDKLLRDKALNIAANPKYWCQRNLASMIYVLLDKKTAGGAVKNKIIQNKELAEEQHKSIIRKIWKTKSTSLRKISCNWKFIRALKDKICKCMTSISKNMPINKLYDIVNKYNNTYHSTIKLKSVDVKSSINIDFNKKINNEGPKYNVENK